MVVVDCERTPEQGTWRRHDSECRLEAGVRFLQAGQIPLGSTHAGAWPSTLNRGSQRHEDWNAFTTALTSCALGEILMERQSALAETLGNLQLAAANFLHSCAADSPLGSYRFWPLAYRARPGPDLDDTALVLLALQAAGVDAAGRSGLECMRLFAPYRYTSGSRLHAMSFWASAFYGAFGTWINESEVIVDVCVNANVVRLLQACQARNVAGYRQAVAMLGAFVETQTLPSLIAPYYRSSAMLAWLCAQLALPDESALHEEVSLRRGLKRRLERPSTLLISFDDQLLAESSRQKIGLPPRPAIMAHLTALQLADGGWPEMSVCWNYAGTIKWTSRSFSTALMLQLLARALRGNYSC